MSVIAVIAKIECDECGVHFSVEVDPACGPVRRWSVWDYAQDAVRGSVGYENKIRSGDGLSSVQAGKMLCGTCTKVADDADKAQGRAACGASPGAKG